MYMSYCKYEGTRAEMNVCIEDVIEHINEEAEYEVSDHEIQQFRKMVHEFVEFMYEADLLDEHGEVNEDALDSVCEAMAKGYEEEE